MPNSGNPPGSVMPESKKRLLAALTAARGAVIEDDIYGDPCFDSQCPWSIKAFDTTGNVLLCSSFSNSLSPSLRIGFVAAGRYRPALALEKTIACGGTNPITQHVLAGQLIGQA